MAEKSSLPEAPLAEHGSPNREHLLEQYKLYVEMADRVSQRRTQANAFYVSLLLALLAWLTFLADRDFSSAAEDAVLVGTGIAGIFVCFIWYVHIRSYRQLNSGKFKVIHEMEQLLPFPCYDREWELLEEGQDKKRYLQLTVVEQLAPLFLALLYSGLILFSVVS
jgi:hypothetical protein